MLQMAEPKEIRKPDGDDKTWRLIGDAQELCRKKCHHLHSKSGKKYDIALFYDEGKFYAISAWCSHMGKFYIICT